MPQEKDQNQNGAAGGQGSGQGSGQQGAGAQNGDQVQRPEYIPEKFWDAEKKAPRIEDLGKSYVELERKLHTRADDLKKQVKEEFDRDLAAKRPQSADLYDLSLPKDLQVPKGYELIVHKDDPMVKYLKETAFELGLDNSQFQKALGAHAQAIFSRLPVFEEEMQKLGENAQARIERVANWVKGRVSDEHYKLLEKMMDRAGAVEAFESIMEKTGEPKFAAQTGAQGSTGGVKSLDELRKLQDDPRYWDATKRDKDYVAMVQREYARAFPGQVTTGGRA